MNKLKTHNMKNIFALLLAAVPFSAISQTTANLDRNNASIFLSDNGVFFNDPLFSEHGYEIPKGGGDHTAYSMGLWLGGRDLGGQLYTACNEYEDALDYFAGPVADDYESDYYTTNFGSAIWNVAQSEIDDHIANYSSGGYVVPASIANWPGNGDPSEGVAEQLAPYEDVNENDVYDPENGDYPLIKGDEAVYIIINDARGIHENSGGLQLGVEVHLMFYQFESMDHLNNTTFLNTKVYNRSEMAYYDFIFGSFLDFDIGYPENDFIGTDSTRNLVYAYNSINIDFGGISGDLGGYEENPPAFGVRFLNQPLDVSMHYLSSSGLTGSPGIPTDYYNYLKAVWKNGAPLHNDGLIGFTPDGYPTKYVYTGDAEAMTGWAETVSSDPSGGDRKLLAASNPVLFNPGDVLCYDMAFVYSREGNNLENVTTLKTISDEIQDYYDLHIESCDHLFTASIAEDKMAKEVLVYPNPTQGHFTVKMDGDFGLKVFSLEGKLIEDLGYHTTSADLQLNLNNGIYLLEISQEGNKQYQKIQLIH
jgi:hypothetical protein